MQALTRKFRCLLNRYMLETFQRQPHQSPFCDSDASPLIEAQSCVEKVYDLSDRLAECKGEQDLVQKRRACLALEQED